MYTSLKSLATDHSEGQRSLQSGSWREGLATTTPGAAPWASSPSGPILASTPAIEILLCFSMKASSCVVHFWAVAAVGSCDSAKPRMILVSCIVCINLAVQHPRKIRGSVLGHRGQFKHRLVAPDCSYVERIQNEELCGERQMRSARLVVAASLAKKCRPRRLGWGRQQAKRVVSVRFDLAP